MDDTWQDRNRIVSVLTEARSALQNSYQVSDYPANGTSEQDRALRSVESLLAALAHRPEEGERHG